MDKNIHVIYFSPTYTSRKNGLSIAQEFSDLITEIDLTVKSKNTVIHTFDKNDIVIFAAPVYSGRLYKGFVERLQMIKGNNTPCIITVTYGNSDFDDALIEMQNEVEKLGFLPFAGAALVGEHTYGKIAIDRPDDKDIISNKNFAKSAVEKYNSGIFSVNVDGNVQYRDGGMGGRFTPITDTSLCCKCGWCVENCPEGAVDKNDFTVIDSDKCISCFRCVKNCPCGAKNVGTQEYITFAEDFSIRLSKRCENKYFL